MATHTHVPVDTHAESEEFNAIIQEARSVLARMDEVKQRFDSVGHKVEQLNGAVEHSKSVLTTASKHLEDAVHHSIEHIEELINACETHHHEIFAKMDHWVVDIKTAGEHFEQSAKHAQTAVDHSKTVSQQMLEQVKHTAHSFVDGAKERVHNLHDHVVDLGKQFESQAHPAMTGFDEFLSHMKEQSETFSHNAHDHVEQFQHQLDSTVHSDLINPMTEHAAQAVQFLAAVGHEDVAGAVTGLMSHGRDLLESGVNSVVSDLTDAVGREMDAVTDAMHKAGGENEAVREALKPVFDVIDSLISPLEETIGNVRSVASAVGVDV